MGRGLSQQQRTILALGVAHGAARNDGMPQVQPLVFDVPAGTMRQTVFGERATRERRVLVSGRPELSEAFLLVALCGFRREQSRVCRWVEASWRARPESMVRKRWRRERGVPDEDRQRDVYQAGYQRYGGVKWQAGTVCHKRRVSVVRSLEALVERELVAYSPGPKWFEGETSYRDPENRSHWTAEQLRAGEVHAAMPDELRRYWSAWRRKDCSAAYVLLPAAFEVVGDAWQVWSPADVLEHWEHAEPAGRRRPAAVAGSGAS